LFLEIPVPTSFDPAQYLLIDDFDTFLRYLESKPNLPLTAGGDLKAANLCRTAVAGHE
jgi:hypothetical protein